MEWGDFLNETAQSVVGYKAAAVMAPSAPVATNLATGRSYREGQPEGGELSLFGIKPVYLIGGGLALALMAGVLLLKR